MRNNISVSKNRSNLMIQNWLYGVNYLSAFNFGCGLNTFFFAAPFIRFFRLDRTSSPAIVPNIHSAK